MELVTPGIGLVFWMILSFGIVFFILKKFAWSPILTTIKEREISIENALNAAEDARQAMKELKQDNERILTQAKLERDVLLKEARETKDSIIAQAKKTASEEADRIVSSARANIETEKLAAITEIKNQVATLSLEIAEKILKEHLSSEEKQKEIIKNRLKEVTLN